MTRVKLPAYDRAPELPAEAEVAFDEIQRLASLARALDPSLPAHVRFFQRAPENALERARAPGRVVFTTDARDHLDNGLQDPNAIDLFDALEKVLPKPIVGALRQRLDAATAAPSQAGIVAQAFGAAQRAGRLDLAATPTHDPDTVIVSSPPLAPAALAFRDDAFLGDVAAQHLTRARLAGEDPAFDFISRVNAVRSALSTDASSLPVSRIAAIVSDIRALDGTPGEPPFEQRAGQGWLAYSILAGGRGWAGPLLAQAPDVASPYTAFRGVSPIAAAVLADDPQSTRALLDAGVSPNVYLTGVPRVLPSASAPGRPAGLPTHAELQEALGDTFPLASLAAATGASQALGQLALGGAMLENRGSGGLTPLHHAVMAGDEPTVRVLLANGAPRDVLSFDNKTAAQLASPALRSVLDAPAGATQAGPRAPWVG